MPAGTVVRWTDIPRTLTWMQLLLWTATEAVIIALGVLTQLMPTPHVVRCLLPVCKVSRLRSKFLKEHSCQSVAQSGLPALQARLRNRA